VTININICLWAHRKNLERGQRNHNQLNSTTASIPSRAQPLVPQSSNDTDDWRSTSKKNWKHSRKEFLWIFATID